MYWTSGVGWLWLFRGLFGLSVLIKCGVEISRGYLSLYQPTTFLFFRLRVLHLRRRRMLPGRGGYLAGHAIRVCAAAALVLGVWPRTAAAVLFVVLVGETKILFRFHVCYMALLSLALVVAPPLPSLFTAAAQISRSGWGAFWEGLSHTTGNSLSYWLIVLTTTALYVGGAWRKLNGDFLSGLVVHTVMLHVIDQAPARRNFDGWYPAALVRRLRATEPGSPAWRLLMAAVVLLEAALPVGLLVPALQPYAIAAGLLMHISFALMFPATLAHFSAATSASYLAFLGAAGTG